MIRKTPLTTHSPGLTLVELLIGFTVGMFVLMAALSLITNVLNTQKSSQHINLLVSTSENVFNELATDIHDAQGATITLNSLTLTDKDGINTVYELDGSTLEKDGLAITPDTVKVASFELLNAAPDTAPPLIHVRLNLENQDPSIPYTSLDRSTTISLRANRSK